MRQIFAAGKLRGLCGLLHVQMRYPLRFGKLVHALALPAVVLAIVLLRALKAQPILATLRGAVVRNAGVMCAAALPAALGAARVVITGMHSLSSSSLSLQMSGVHDIPIFSFPQVAVVYINSLCLLRFRKIRDAGHAFQHMLAKTLLDSLYVWQHGSTLCMLPNGAFCSDGSGPLYRQADDMVWEVFAGACGKRPCCTGGPAAAVCAAPTSSFQH